MTTPGSLGLARVTVASPKRRIDIALPENVPVGELLPSVLRHAGEGAADEGELHGGWMLRRTTGAVLETERNLSAQGVRDGEVLHLAPRRADWPEPEYDDVVEVVASGARRFGRSWSGAATRACALAATATLLLAGLALLVVTGPSWTVPGVIALSMATVLLVAGIVTARAMADVAAGTLLGGVALVYAFAGGLFVAAPDDVKLTGLGVPHLLVASITLFAVALIGYFGVGGGTRVFVAGAMTGLSGAVAGLAGYTGQSAAGGAAVAATLAIGLLPAYPLLSIRMGRLPVPELPSRPEEMLVDKPVPPRSQVYASVVRADETLTGLLTGTAVVSAIAMAFLATSGGVTGVCLVATAVAALLLRARLFPTARHRVPLIVSGLVGVAMLTLAFAFAVDNALLMLFGPLTLAVIAGVVLTGGLVYSKRAPSPYIGRLADTFDVLAIMALVPLACGVLGVYTAVQGLFASFG
ncbi:type VII secretion integral membrane protein EccD [Longispora fulva]|nr:type VII secretion integral membrane protein EccD [Longispora fulva]